MNPLQQLALIHSNWVEDEYGWFRAPSTSRPYEVGDLTLGIMSSGPYR